MSVGSPLMENVLTPLAKKRFGTIRTKRSSVSTRCNYSKENIGSGMIVLIILNKEMEKDGTSVINLDEYKSVETHWIVLYVNVDNATYFHSFRVEYIPKEIKKFIHLKNILKNIYRIQVNDSIMFECFCIGSIDFMLVEV